MSESRMTPDKATALRRPFPRESIGKLPKGGQMLDFAGHAVVTDRLLAIDPEWSWDFAESDPATGLPSLRFSIDPEKNLWIRLTVCGVTRIGVGDGPTAKEKISDAIRNAAMRFGVALDLWAKENLVEFAQAAQAHQAPVSQTPPTQLQHEEARLPDEKPMTARTRGEMFALFGQKGITEDQQLDGINRITGASYTSRGHLSEAHALEVITSLKALPGAEVAQ
jgi:hypothetical protein